VHTGTIAVVAKLFSSTTYTTTQPLLLEVLQSTFDVEHYSLRHPASNCSSIKRESTNLIQISRTETLRRAAAVYNVPERPSSADTLESTHGTRIGALDARTQNLRHCDTMVAARAQILPSLARRNDMFVNLSFPPTILLQHVQSGLLRLRTSTMSKSCNWWRIPWQFSNRRDYRIVKAGLNDNQVDHTSLT
jgi:hypothetical protein